MPVRMLGLSLALLCALAASAQTPGPAAPTAGPAPSAFVVKFKVKAGKNADFERAFREMQAGVRAQEPGNVYYDLYVTDRDPQTYVIVEHYKDQAAVAAHGKSKHAQKLIATLRDLLEGPPDVERLILVSAK
jgi:quinol monooxygenase YgiN